MRAMQSIRARLSGAVIAISIVWMIVVTAAVWTVIRHEVNELLDNTLQESTEILSDVLFYSIRQLPLRESMSAPMPAPAHIEHLIWQVVDHRNITRLRSHTAPETPLLPVQTLGFADAGAHWRVFGMALPGENGAILYVAQASSERQEAGFDAAKYTAGTTLLIGLACVLWLRRRLRKELAPIAHLSDAVARFDPFNKSSALPMVDRLELIPIHQAITSLGTRLAQRIANERAFSAHAAHALRTPLAGIDAQLAVAMRESPEHMHPRLQKARAAATRLQRVVTALLTLFRTGSEPQLRNVSMHELVAHLPVDGLAVRTEGVDLITVDPDLLAAALMNLLDNAARHDASEVAINVRNNGGLVIVLQDNGCGIAEDKRVQLQQAIDAQDYSGQTGLGLMLADMVARAHHGKLLLRRTMQGCTVELHIPSGALQRSNPTGLSGG